MFGDAVASTPERFLTDNLLTRFNEVMIESSALLSSGCMPCRKDPTCMAQRSEGADVNDDGQR